MKSKLGNWFTNRGLDMLPGLFVWFVLIGLFIGSYFVPDIVASFIIFFNVYFLQKTLRMNYHFIISFIRIRVWKLINWDERVRSLKSRDTAISYLENLKMYFSSLSLKQMYKLNYDEDVFVKIPFFLEIPLLLLQKTEFKKFIDREYKRLGKSRDNDIIWETDKIKHIIIVPFATEPYSVLKPSIDRIANQSYDTKKFILVLATEKACPQSQELADKLYKEFRDKFYDIWITVHELKPDEIRGKSANMGYAASCVDEKIKKLGWDTNYLTITSCDCDSWFPKDYFNALTYEFCVNPKRNYTYWHAAMSYYANIWEVPFYIRVANTLFSYTALANHSKKELIQVSTYSSSYNLVKGIGFWTRDKIPEDWNMFFKAVFSYGEDVRVIPLFMRILSDAAGSTTHWKSVVNQYEQVKRWSWGVSDDSWILKNIFKLKKNVKNKLYIFYRGISAVADHFLWPLYGFVLGFGANIPPLINKKFSFTIYGRNLPPTASKILTFSTIMFFIIILLDSTLKKPKPKSNNLLDIFLYFVEFVFLPVTSILFGSLPALDAHTRLLLGNRLEYRITEKK